jgi:hypothetical protein
VDIRLSSSVFFEVNEPGAASAEPADERKRDAPPVK